VSDSTTIAPNRRPGQRPTASELHELARRVDLRCVLLALEPDIRDQLAREHRTLARAGTPTRPKITCPFHAPDHHPSLELDLPRNRWICRSCPRRTVAGSQSTIDLVMAIKDWNFAKARDWLIDLSRRDDVAVVDLDHIQPATSESDDARLTAVSDLLDYLIEHPIGAPTAVQNWAQGRGLPDDFDLTNDVIPFDSQPAYRAMRRRFSDTALATAGFVTATGRPLLTRRQALIIFRDLEKRPVWAQGIFTSPPPTRKDGTTPEKYLGLAGPPATWPFGAHVAATGGYALAICEGAVDALSVQAHLGVAAIGLPGAQPRIPKHWLELLRRWQRLVLAHDPDPSGDSGAEYLVASLERHGLRWRYSRWAPISATSDINDSLRDGPHRALPTT
jgi:hypothetical protein